MDVNSFNILEQRLLYIYSYLKVAMVEQLQRQGHTVTEKLLNSIDKEIHRGTDYIQLDCTFIFYGRFVDTGRKAGGKKVPIDALVDWIKAKGFESDAKKIKGMAFAIQQTIWKKGISQPTSWRRTSTAGWMSKPLKNKEEKIENDVFDAVGESLELIIFNALKEIESKSNNVTVK